MFEEIRDSLRELLYRARTPEDRRAALHEMKETLVRARLGVEDLQQGLSKTRVELGLQRRELETVRRRRDLAAGINDQETVKVAERFEHRHGERVAILERKLAVQEQELALVEAEVAAMTADFKSAMAGAGTPAPAATAAAADPLEEGRLDAELDGLSRASRRAANEQAAADRLADLKRRMGK